MKIGFGCFSTWPLPRRPSPMHKVAWELLIGVRVRELREKRGMTQQETAARAGVSRTYLSRIENCLVLPSPAALRRVAETLQVEILKLLAVKRNGEDISLTEEASAFVKRTISTDSPPLNSTSHSNISCR